METAELTVIDVQFVDQTTPTHNDLVNVTVSNSGTASVTINQVRINGNTISSADWDLTSGETAIAPGDTDAVEINLALADAWVSGNKYSITFFAKDGTMIGSFTDTA
jgi:archaellum component FlaF (FlaF/FlaG flagellin family)